MTTLTKEDTMSQFITGDTVTSEAMSALQNVFHRDLANAQPGLQQGLINLKSAPEFDLPNNSPAPVPGHGEVQRGVIGFRRMAKQMTLALACGMAPIVYFPLAKYNAMIEGAHDERSANVNVQNPVQGKDGCGQIIARLNLKHSAIHVVHGIVGRVIREPKHISSNEVYYVPRAIMARYFLAAKAQIEAGDQLDSMIAAYDGLQEYSIPLDPLNPEQE